MTTSIILIPEPHFPTDQEIRNQVRFMVKQLCRKIRCVRAGTYRDPKGRTVSDLRSVLRDLVFN